MNSASILSLGLDFCSTTSKQWHKSLLAEQVTNTTTINY